MCAWASSRSTAEAEARRAFQDQPAPVLVAPARSADVPVYLDAVGNTRR